MSATIVVSRTSERDIKMRDLYVSVDGGPERTILFGDFTAFEVEPGEHTVKVDNRLYAKELSVTLGESEEVRFLGSNVWAGGIFAWALVILTGAYKVTLERI